LAIVAAAVWSFWGTGLESGSRIVIYVSNQKFGWYDLSEPQRLVDIPTRIGTVQAQIGDGDARILNAPCPNKLCMRHGKLRGGRDQLVCLPARVLIVREGQRSDHGSSSDGVEGPDAITQ
jgi:hypothetical protein